MTLVPASQHVYYVTAAYAVALGGLAALLLFAWMSARTWTRRADAARAARRADG